MGYHIRASRFLRRDGRHVRKSWWLRHPRTTQERRRWFADLERQRDHPELKLRPRRGARHLPNAWDDLSVGLVEDRSWKRRHKTQYAPVNR